MDALPPRWVVVDDLIAELRSWSTDHVIGQHVAGSVPIEQITADAYRDYLLSHYPESAWDVRVEVFRPYSCPVWECPVQEPTGTTCPIHLRDLRLGMLDVQASATSRNPITMVHTTVRVA